MVFVSILTHVYTIDFRSLPVCHIFYQSLCGGKSFFFTFGMLCLFFGLLFLPIQRDTRGWKTHNSMREQETKNKTKE